MSIVLASSFRFARRRDGTRRDAAVRRLNYRGLGGCSGSSFGSFSSALTLGIALIVSCANLFFRDVKYIVQVLITFGVFFTPVFY